MCGWHACIYLAHAFLAGVLVFIYTRVHEKEYVTHARGMALVDSNNAVADSNNAVLAV